jgi:signal recognition particle receptor subunit beta
MIKLVVIPIFFLDPSKFIDHCSDFKNLFVRVSTPADKGKTVNETVTSADYSGSAIL